MAHDLWHFVAVRDGRASLEAERGGPHPRPRSLRACIAFRLHDARPCKHSRGGRRTGRIVYHRNLCGSAGLPSPASLGIAACVADRAKSLSAAKERYASTQRRRRWGSPERHRRDGVSSRAGDWRTAPKSETTLQCHRRASSRITPPISRTLN